MLRPSLPLAELHLAALTRFPLAMAADYILQIHAPAIILVMDSPCASAISTTAPEAHKTGRRRRPEGLNNNQCTVIWSALYLGP